MSSLQDGLFRREFKALSSLRIVTACAGLIASGAVFAGESVDGSKEMPALTESRDTLSPFEIRVGLPGFLSSVTGDFGVKGVVVDLDVHVIDMVKKLDAVPLVLSTYVRYKRWEFFADGEWAQVATTASLRGLLFTDASIKAGFAYWEGFVGYRLLEGEKVTLSLYSGARYSYYSADLRIHNSNDPRFPLYRQLLGIPQSGGKSGDEGWVDPVLGINGRVHVAKAFSLYANGDVGGFDATSGSAFKVVETHAGVARVSTASSDWSYQLQGGVEIQMTRNIWSQIGWRYLKYDYQIGGFVNKTAFNGPFIAGGVNF